MVKKLENVSSIVYEAKKIEREVERVISILKTSAKPMRAKEVAELLTRSTPWTESGVSGSSVQHATKMLTLAKNMGVVKREEIAESEPIEVTYSHYGLLHEEPVIIDGVEYVKKDSNRYGYHSHTKTIQPKVVYFSIA